jgi:aldose 1-epimerase
MKIIRKTFGLLSNGKKAALYTLKAGDLSFSITNFGGHWVSLYVPSRKGPRDDVLLGYSTLEGYTRNETFLGSTVGRVCNRIGGGEFTLDGKIYRLFQNAGPNTLHGGRRGFNQRLWKAECYEERDGVFIRLSLDSPGGEEGFPGNLKAVVSYGLTKSNEIIAVYEAKVDAPCPVNLTNHAYFNLAGEGSGPITGHHARLFASSLVEVDANLIPTGKLTPLAGGPFDFTSPKLIGRDLEAAGGGYDHCFILDGEAGELRPCAEIGEEGSGRTMRVFTTQPGVQFYTGNFLAGVPGKAGSVYHKHGGFCLETQFLPDSPNRPEFPPVIYGPGKNFQEKSVFSFDW